MSTQMENEFKEKKNQVIVKVGMLGDSGIGKTSLMVKYIEDKYDEDYIETLGVNFMEKKIELKNVMVTISIWDLGGQREFATLMPLVCSDAKVILFSFDLTQKQSLFSVKRWYKEARKENKIFISFLIGTKFDLFEELEDHHKTDITRQARKFAKKMHAPLIYCSSARSVNVKNIFKVIIAKVFDLKPRIKEIHDPTHQKGIIEFEAINGGDANEDADCEQPQNEKKKKKKKKKKDKDKDRKKKDKKKKRKKDKKKKKHKGDTDTEAEDTEAEERTDAENSEDDSKEDQ